MDLSVSTLGLTLPTPLVIGASPISDDIDAVRRLVDAGAGAVVMHSLFMEQITWEQEEALQHKLAYEESYAEALSYLPEPPGFALGPDEYLEQVAALKRAVDVPVIASLNGTESGEWTHHAALIEQAGADALELNIYYLPLEGVEPPEHVERRFVDVLRAVDREVDLPVQVKLTSYFSSPIHLARRLVDAGAEGLVLFNRLFPADIDIEDLELVPALHLSGTGLLSERLLWLAAMYGQVEADLACSGGVYESAHAIKAMMAGATTVQMASALLAGGPDLLVQVRTELEAWLEEHEYDGLDSLVGSMSRRRCPDPDAWDRPNYMRTLQQWVPRW